MKKSFIAFIVFTGLLALSGCVNFMCDHCSTPSARKSEYRTYQATPQISTAPSHINHIHSPDGSLGYGRYRYQKDGQMIAIFGSHHTLYQGKFTNPLPIISPKGERYLLDFRLKQNREWGQIYLLTPHDIPNVRPTKVGEFKP